MSTTTTGSAIERTFDERGYLLIPDALSTEYLREVNAALDADLRAADWPLKRGEGQRQDANILPRMPILDHLVENPKLMPIVRSLLGEAATFDEFSIMFRDPTDNVPEQHGWHRDFPRAEDYPHGLHALSLIYYLSDVSESDHCFCVAAGTHNAGRSIEAHKHDPADEVDIVGKAGTAVFFHTALLHTAKLKRGSRQRRTVHIYYGHADTPQVSAYSDIPDRLRDKRDPSLPAKFYTKRREASAAS